MSVRTLNAAGSTLSPFKGEIMAYYMFDEIPAPNFPYKAEYNDDLFVPLFSRDSIIKGSLMTIELRNITEVRDIVFSRDERGPKTLFIRSGFDINGNMLDAKKTIEESTNFANKFLNDISAVLTDAYRAKIFKINEWLEPPLLKLTLPDEDSKISEEAELDKSHRSTPRMSHSSTKRAVQDAQEPSPKKRKASSCAGDIKKVTQPSVSHKPPASLPKTTEISAADILIASPTRVSEISEPSIKTVPVAIGSSVDHTRINYTPLVNTE
ncbi:hypothetical protein RF11_00694 [Thelohanellus kitauei]|uniref:Uncharacterized protein n=1 Tax=Thelohanellus kitauei TaxID=669202 RepID=A0A0C2N4T0_THEKT|nr:hypothetical protein RF11_00694 [Thelohanellus kitauei]